MSITRRQAFAATAALAGAGALGRVSPAFAQGAHAGKEVKVLAVQATQFQAHEKRAKAFTEQTGAKVTFVYVPFVALRERLTAEMVGGSADFDVITAMDVWIPPLMDKYLAPIDGRLPGAKIDMERYPGAFRAAGKSTVNGGTYGLPNRCHIQLLWYRKDLFDKAGLKPPATWAELVETGRKVQEANPGIAGVTIPYARNDGQNLMVWYNFLWGAGGDLFDTQMRPIFNSAAGVQATQDFVDIILKHKITPPGAASFNETESILNFVQGKSAMTPCWWHIYNRFRMPDSIVKLDQVGFTPLPSYRGAGPTTYTNQWIYGLNKNSKNQDAAFAFMAFASQPEIERDILLDPAESDVVSVHWQNLRDPQVNARFNGMHGIAAKALETTTKAIPNIPEFLPVVDVLASAMSEIVATGGADVKGKLDGAAAQVARIMRRAG
jgi:multiple sugar transport system substrate-binding protein